MQATINIESFGSEEFKQEEFDIKVFKKKVEWEDESYEGGHAAIINGEPVTISSRLMKSMYFTEWKSFMMMAKRCETDDKKIEDLYNFPMESYFNEFLILNQKDDSIINSLQTASIPMLIRLAQAADFFGSALIIRILSQFDRLAETMSSIELLQYYGAIHNQHLNRIKKLYQDVYIRSFRKMDLDQLMAFGRESEVYFRELPENAFREAFVQCCTVMRPHAISAIEQEIEIFIERSEHPAWRAVNWSILQMNVLSREFVHKHYGNIVERLINRTNMRLNHEPPAPGFDDLPITHYTLVMTSNLFPSRYQVFGEARSAFTLPSIQAPDPTSALGILHSARAGLHRVPVAPVDAAEIHQAGAQVHQDVSAPPTGAALYQATRERLRRTDRDPRV